MTSWLHLGRRFVGSLPPGGPDATDETWVQEWLVSDEQELWARMSGPDRRHAVAVARATAAILGSDSSRPVIAAALLHDVGKIESGLGTLGRVVATLWGMIQARDRIRGRFGSYLRHDSLGAELLAGAGSDPLTVTWAAEHHLPPSRWTLDPRVAAALKAADDD